MSPSSSLRKIRFGWYQWWEKTNLNSLGSKKNKRLRKQEGQRTYHLHSTPCVLWVESPSRSTGKRCWRCWTLVDRAVWDIGVGINPIFGVGYFWPHTEKIEKMSEVYGTNQFLLIVVPQMKTFNDDLMNFERLWNLGCNMRRELVRSKSATNTHTLPKYGPYTEKSIMSNFNHHIIPGFYMYVRLQHFWTIMKKRCTFSLLVSGSPSESLKKANSPTLNPKAWYISCFTVDRRLSKDCGSVSSLSGHRFAKPATGRLRPCSCNDQYTLFNNYLRYTLFTKNKAP